MIEIIYASAATAPFSPKDLQALLSTARSRNREVEVSGLLLYHQGSFLQVIEGEPEAVEGIYQRIGADRRHKGHLLLRKGEIPARRFAAWEMGFLGLTTAAAGLLEGFSDFLRHGVLGLSASPGAVQRVVAAFREGQYHQHIR